jgi:hypothetical protein
MLAAILWCALFAAAAFVVLALSNREQEPEQRTAWLYPGVTEYQEWRNN